MTQKYYVLLLFLLSLYPLKIFSNIPMLPLFETKESVLITQAEPPITSNDKPQTNSKAHAAPQAQQATQSPPIEAQPPAQQQATSQTTSVIPQPAPSSQTHSNRRNEPIQTTMVSGKQAVPISGSMPLKQAVSILGRDVSEATNMLFNKIRTQVDMPFLCNLKILDDESEFTKTRSNVLDLQVNHSPLFLNFIDTDTVAAVMPMIKKGSIAAFFPLDGHPEHRLNGHSNIVYFRPTYEQEVSSLIDYSIHELNNKKFAIFYEESTWGKEVLRIFKKVLEKYQTPESNVEFVAEGSYQKGTVNISQALKTITAKSPTALFVVARARPAYNFISQVINEGLHKTTIFGLSSLIPIRKTLKRSRGVSIIASSVVPNPEKSQLPIAQEYRADMQKYLSNRKPTVPSFEAYINVLLFLEALKAVALPPTINSIMSVFKNIKNINFKGLMLSYKNKTLSHQVWISTDDNKEWFKSKIA